MEIKDSGERREFETGSVRDRAVGKGLPALISAPLMCEYFAHFASSDFNDEIIGLYKILADGAWPRAITIFNSLINYHGFYNATKRLSIQLEMGAIKYGTRNWEKGQPMESYVNSALRHIFAMLDGKDDEDHYAAALFNVMGLWHTGHMISKGLLPDTLNDLPGGANE